MPDGLPPLMAEPLFFIPMFSYYGSKSRVIDLYPPPKYCKIIEPFAGSARYSLKYFDREIILIDKYKAVIDVWNYLKRASVNDILALPKLKRGMLISELNISYEERLFLGFLAGAGSHVPRNKVSSFSDEQGRGDYVIKRIIKHLYKVKEWTIIHGDYFDVDNIECTYFIDPPYQFGGKSYVCNKIDYVSLKEWIISRRGQVIACENTKANWMDFEPITKMRGANRLYTTEAMWTNNFHNRQLNLF